MQEKWILKAKYRRKIITFYMDTNFIELSTLLYYYYIIALLLLLFIITFVEGIYNYVPETNHVLGYIIIIINFWFIQWQC